jgi:hypothetical protein
MKFLAVMIRNSSHYVFEALSRINPKTSIGLDKRKKNSSCVSSIKASKKEPILRANDVRDGVKLSMQQRERTIVKASEIRSLRNNKGFLKLAGGMAVSKLRFSIF